MTQQITTLSNGLRVVTDPMPHLETAAVGVWVDTGARHESKDVNGISHVLEHMAFKGTKTRSALEIAETIEAVGGHLNAYTSRDQTAYFARVLEKDLALGVDILADILQNSTFDEQELTREKEVIVQEIGQTNDTPDDIIFDHLQETAFPEQALGRSILGPAENVRSFSRELISNYMTERYKASKMVLSASGAVSHDELVALAEEKFSNLSNGTEREFEPGKFVGGDYREQRELEQVHFTMSVPGVSYEDEDFYASQILSGLLGGGMSSRLFQEVRERRGLCYSIFSFASSFSDCGLFTVYAGTGEGQISELSTVVADELLKVSKTVTEAELERAKAQHKAGLLMGMESPASRCEAHARQMLIYGRVISPTEIAGLIDEISIERLQRLAERLFVGAKPAVASLGPIKNLETYERFAARFS
ncbi:M16 family metallopeptidase [Sneathiella glossodoripedis]|uniref:M16 family metallopeptidase n=1 Tax=Sneathiella glossodoripedis TaxID=418853 RepID=UPI00046EB4E3|nr:pitrilysin family protein [Sneathiella glossodoripedis]